MMQHKERKYYRKASRFFSYRIVVPSNADQTRDSEAIFKDGMIHICFPKQGKKRKTIRIQEG